MTKVNGWKPLIDVTKSSILVVAGSENPSTSVSENIRNNAGKNVIASIDQCSSVNGKEVTALKSYHFITNSSDDPLKGMSSEPPTQVEYSKH